MGKSTPDAPDPYKTAGAQTKMNVQTAIANTVMGTGKQIGPDGQQNTTISGWRTVNIGGKKVRVPITQTKTTLSPELAAANTSANQGLSAFAKMGQGMIGDYGNTDRAMSYGTDFSGDRQRVEEAMTARMQPGMDRDRAQLEERLASQGITIGSEPYMAAMDDLNRGVNDARLGVIGQGGQEQSRLVGLERDRAGFENQARDSQFQEIMAMLGGGKGQIPQFGGKAGGQLPSTDMGALFNAQYQGQMDAYNAKQQTMGGLMGGLAALIGASDRRLKTEIRKVGKRGGLNLYEYRYLWDKPGTIRRGYMAQEVLSVFPAAVCAIAGWLALDYAQLPEVS